MSLKAENNIYLNLRINSMNSPVLTFRIGKNGSECEDDKPNYKVHYRVKVYSSNENEQERYINLHVCIAQLSNTCLKHLCVKLEQTSHKSCVKI